MKLRQFLVLIVLSQNLATNSAFPVLLVALESTRTIPTDY